jgi:hypothetical protein
MANVVKVIKGAAIKKEGKSVVKINSQQNLKKKK